MYLTRLVIVIETELTTHVNWSFSVLPLVIRRLDKSYLACIIVIVSVKSTKCDWSFFIGNKLITIFNWVPLLEKL